MDWTAQSEEMLKGWTEVQKKMWDAWLTGVRDAAQPTAAEGWQQLMERVSQAWAQSVGRALDAQAEWTRIWAESLAGGRGEAAGWAKQFSDAMRAWVEMQKQLWQTWFDTFKRIGPDRTAGAFDDLWRNWETAARQGLEAQAAWMNAWTPKPAAKTRAGG